MRSLGTPSTLLRILDPLLIVATGLVSYWLRFDDLELPPWHQGVIFAAFALAVLVFAGANRSGDGLDERLRRNLLHVVIAWAVVFAALLALLFATRVGAAFSRQWFGVWSLLALGALIAVRLVLVVLLQSLRRRGLMVRRVAIVGAGELGRQVLRQLRATPTAGVAVVGLYDDDPALAGRLLDGVPVRGAAGAVVDDIRADRVDQVWIALPLRAEDRVREVLSLVDPFNVEVSFVPDIFGFRLLNHSVTEVGGLPVIKLTESPLSGPKGMLKWIEDKVIALAMLAVLWPVLAAIAIGVKLSSPGPAIFRQKRGGIDNREIKVWKFRTMYVHQPPPGELPQATRDDPRVTRFGAFLRRTSLDELPQFINVLMGDMSVVGPRPHALAHNDFYQARIPNYLRRTWLKPGITGWAQVNGWRGETDEDWKMEMRVQHDLWYVEHWSLALDLYIILMTVFRMRGERAY